MKQEPLNVVKVVLWCEYDVFLLVTQAYSDKVKKKKIRVLPTEVEPMTFRLVLRMLYHWATGDSW